MNVAVFIHCDNFARACADLRFRLVLKVYHDPAGLCLHIDECYVMLRQHGVCDTSDLNLYSTVINALDIRNMLFPASLRCIRYKFLHLLTAAYYRYF